MQDNCSKSPEHLAVAVLSAWSAEPKIATVEVATAIVRIRMAEQQAKLRRVGTDIAKAELALKGPAIAVAVEQGHAPVHHCRSRFLAESMQSVPPVADSRRLA